MKCIRPYLFVGPGVLAQDVPQLRRAGISAVLSLQEPGVDLLASAIERMRVACEPAIVFRNVAVRDYDPMALIHTLPQALGCLRALVEDGHTVYLHCSEGINRAPSLALAYLVRHESLAVMTARSLIASCHPAAHPYDVLLQFLESDLAGVESSDA